MGLGLRVPAQTLISLRSTILCCIMVLFVLLVHLSIFRRGSSRKQLEVSRKKLGTKLDCFVFRRMTSTRVTTKSFSVTFCRGEQTSRGNVSLGLTGAEWASCRDLANDRSTRRSNKSPPHAAIDVVRLARIFYQLPGRPLAHFRFSLLGAKWIFVYECSAKALKGQPA